MGKPCEQIRHRRGRCHGQSDAALEQGAHELERARASRRPGRVELHHVLTHHAHDLLRGRAQPELRVEELACLGGGHRCQPVFVGWRELAARTMRELAFHLAPHAHAVEERAVTVEYHADWSLARHLAVLSPVSLFPLEPSKKESCPAVRRQAFGRVARGLAPVAENETLHVLVDHDGEESQKENHSRRAHIAQGAHRHVLAREFLENLDDEAAAVEGRNR